MWAAFKGVKLAFGRRGKPVDNAMIESLNGRLPTRCSNQHWFLSMHSQRPCKADSPAGIKATAAPGGGASENCMSVKKLQKHTLGCYNFPGVYPLLLMRIALRAAFA